MPGHPGPCAGNSWDQTMLRQHEGRSLPQFQRWKCDSCVWLRLPFLSYSERKYYWYSYRSTTFSALQLTFLPIQTQQPCIVQLPLEWSYLCDFSRQLAPASQYLCSKWFASQRRSRIYSHNRLPVRSWRSVSLYLEYLATTIPYLAYALYHLEGLYYFTSFPTSFMRVQAMRRQSPLTSHVPQISKPECKNAKPIPAFS